MRRGGTYEVVQVGDPSIRSYQMQAPELNEESKAPQLTDDLISTDFLDLIVI